jgi:xanthine/uracil permease
MSFLCYLFRSRIKKGFQILLGILSACAVGALLGVIIGKYVKATQHNETTTTTIATTVSFFTLTSQDWSSI